MDTRAAKAFNELFNDEHSLTAAIRYSEQLRESETMSAELLKGLKGVAFSECSNDELRESKTMSTELEQIESRMKAHDWWYHMADDGNAFRRGETASESLKRFCLAAKDQAGVKALWDKHCPVKSGIYYDGSPRPDAAATKVS